MSNSEMCLQLNEMAEFLARELAAEKLGLVNDPCGERLPEDLWRRELPEARSMLGIEPTIN